MQNLHKDLIELLKNEDNLVVEGDLNKNKIIELALKVEPQLIRVLISSDTFKKHFFQKIDEVLVFDKIKFQRFVNNKSFLPDSYTAFKNKIGLTINDETTDNYITASKDVVLAFPHKDCVLEGGQSKEDQKRNEVFWNETLAPDSIDRLLAPKVLNNFKKYDKDGERKVNGFTHEDNLILKGNNLLCLVSLLKTHRGRVKLCYLDPPYNTGGANETFTYNNTFKHSTWLSFMKTRIQLAKELLLDDGFIALTIDHFELFYIGCLMDEVFGRENRIGVVTIVHKPEGRNQEKFFGTSNEFMLVYSKNKSVANFQKVILDEEHKDKFKEQDDKGTFRYKNFIRLTDGKYALREKKPEFYYPIYVSKNLRNISLENFEDSIEVYPITDKGVERTWKTKPETFEKYLREGNIEAKEEVEGEIIIYEKLREDQVIKTHWIKKEYHAYHFGTKLLEKTLGKKAFSFPKSLYAVIDTIKLMTGSNDLIVDLFGGSGTTAHAVLELNKQENTNRRYILVEQLDEHIEICLERISIVQRKNGSNNFIYAELLKYNQVYLDQIQEANTKETLVEIWQEMKEKAFLAYQFDTETFDARIDAFKTGTIEQMQKYLLELLDKNLLYVNLSEMEDETYGVSDEVKALNKLFYNTKF